MKSADMGVEPLLGGKGGIFEICIAVQPEHRQPRNVARLSVLWRLPVSPTRPVETMLLQALRAALPVTPDGRASRRSGINGTVDEKSQIQALDRIPAACR